MASPSVVTTATSGGNASGGTFSVTLPTGIASGDKLLICVGHASNMALTTPGGWNLVETASNIGGIGTCGSIFSRDADGTEGTSLTISYTTNGKWACTAYRISGADAASTFSVSADATGVSKVEDATAVTPPGGSKDYLYILTGMHNDVFVPSGAPPTGYSNALNAQSTGGGSANSKVTVDSAEKATTATTTENPGTWTVTAGADVAWVTWVVAIPPAPPAVYQPRYGNVNFQDPGVFAVKRGIRIPRLWKPKLWAPQRPVILV